MVPVQLNRHKFKTIHVTAREAAETALNVLDTLVSSAVKQLAQRIGFVQSYWNPVEARRWRHGGSPSLRSAT